MKIESITENPLRIENFTSSEIWKLTKTAKDGKSFGEPALTYIKEKLYEKRLQRSLQLEKYSRSTLWGKFIEQRVHNLLPTCYETLSNVTTQHPEILFWTGSQDSIIRTEKVMCDIKCYEPKNFCEYVDALTWAKANNDLSQLKKDFAQQYWQLVSNACIWEYDFIEAIVYMPYFSELEEIKEMASNYDGIDLYKYRFIYESSYTELPYLNKDGFYKNLNIFRFVAPLEDKLLLKTKVIEAGKLLNNLK